MQKVSLPQELMFLKELKIQVGDKKIKIDQDLVKRTIEKLSDYIRNHDREFGNKLFTLIKSKNPNTYTEINRKIDEQLKNSKISKQKKVKLFFEKSAIIGYKYSLLMKKIYIKNNIKDGLLSTIKPTNQSTKIDTLSKYIIRGILYIQLYLSFSKPQICKDERLEEFDNHLYSNKT